MSSKLYKRGLIPHLSLDPGLSIFIDITNKDQLHSLTNDIYRMRIKKDQAMNWKNEPLNEIYKAAVKEMDDVMMSGDYWPADAMREIKNLMNSSDLEVTNNLGSTVLHEASRMGFTKTAKYLIAKGANVNSICAIGTTPLHAAALNNHIEIAQALIDANANVNATVEGIGVTPLHWAAERGHSEVCSLLLDVGADTTIKSKCGRTAQEDALRYNHTKVVAILEQAEKNAHSSESGKKTRRASALKPQ